MTQTQAPRGALASLALSMLLSSLGTSAANVALPVLEHGFGAAFATVQWVVLGYLLAITITIVNAGRLADILGPQPMILAGLSLFAVASLLCGVAPDLGLLIAARILQGVGAAILMTLAVAAIRDTVAPERMGRAMGLLGTMSAVGTAAGPSLGGLLIAGFGWRAIFFAMALMGGLIFLLAAYSLPRREEARAARPEGFDIAGAAVLGLTLASYALAMTAGGHGADRKAALLLLAALIGGALFFRLQARREAPLVPLESFRDPGLANGLATNTLVATVMMATLVVGPFYLSRGLGLGTAAVGLVLSIGPIVSTLTGVPAGRLADRFGAPAMRVAGLVLMVLGTIALSTLPELFGVAGYVAAIAVLTPGYQLFQASNNTMVMREVAAGRKGVVSGMLGLSRNLGLITGASAMGAVFSVAAGTTDMTIARPQAVAAGMQATFAVAVALVLVALLLAARRRVPATQPR